MTIEPPPQNGDGDSLVAARRAHADGRFKEAEAHYQTLLAIEPRNATAILQFGVLRMQQGRVDDAIALTRHALGLDPNSTEAHANLAVALHLSQRDDESIQSYEAALSLDPDRPESHYGLGIVLLSRMQLDEAVACFERALAIDSDYAEADCALGVALHSLKRDADALAYFDKALEIDPDYVEALVGRGSILRAMGRNDEAVASYERALGIVPDNLDALNGLGAALQDLSRHEAALAQLRRALAVNPSSSETQKRIGILLEELGRTREAQLAFAAAIESETGNVGFRAARIASRRVQEDDPDLAALEKLARSIEERPLNEQIALHFGLGKALSDVGRDDESFSHLVRGNALKRQQISYEEAETLALFDRIKAVFTAEFVDGMKQTGHASSRPIFIIGMPRSGSTLVEQILASHSSVFGGGELNHFGEAVASVAGLTAPRALYPDNVCNLTGEQVHRLGAEYIGRLDSMMTGPVRAERTTDKMLANFCFAGLIHMALPNARILHTRRNPVDTCLSCFAQLFGSGQPFAYDLGELGRYYRAYQTLMTHWRNVLPNDLILDVDYEKVVEDFEAQARRILAHCGLEWDPACLSFHTTERLVRTASVSQVRQPLYANSIGRWRPAPDVLDPLLRGLEPNKS